MAIQSADLLLHLDENAPVKEIVDFDQDWPRDNHSLRSFRGMESSVWALVVIAISFVVGPILLYAVTTRTSLCPLRRRHDRYRYAQPHR